MSLQEHVSPASETIQFNPTVKVDKANFVWEIESYLAYHQEGKSIKSSVFTSDTNKQLKWFLKLYPNSILSNVADPSLSVFLCLDPTSCHQSAFVRPKLSIIDNQKSKSYGKLGPIHKYTASPMNGPLNSYGWPEFIKINELFSGKFLSNGKLTLCCEVTFFRIDENLMDNMSDQYDSFSLQPNVPKYDLSADLRSLLTNQQFADVVISINGKEYPVHKAILAARSPVFVAMFQHNMQENKTNRVDITDVEERVVEEMLRYMYTGTCENLKELADGLILVADKYDLQGLKVMCEESLIENLSVENATCTLILSDMHRAEKLKSKTLRYIVSKASKIMKTKSWKSLAPLNVHLIMEVSEALARAFHRTKTPRLSKKGKSQSSRDVLNSSGIRLILPRAHMSGPNSRSNDSQPENNDRIILN